MRIRRRCTRRRASTCNADCTSASPLPAIHAPGGTISRVGEYWGQDQLERSKREWMLNDITLVRSSYFPIAEFSENQQLVLDGKLNAKALVTHTFPLAEIRAAYDRFAAADTLKVMVHP